MKVRKHPATPKIVRLMTVVGLQLLSEEGLRMREIGNLGKIQKKMLDELEPERKHAEGLRASSIGMIPTTKSRGRRERKRSEEN